MVNELLYRKGCALCCRPFLGSPGCHFGGSVRPGGHFGIGDHLAQGDPPQVQKFWNDFGNDRFRNDFGTLSWKLFGHRGSTFHFVECGSFNEPRCAWLMIVKKLLVPIPRCQALAARGKEELLDSVHQTSLSVTDSQLRKVIWCSLWYHWYRISRLINQWTLCINLIINCSILPINAGLTAIHKPNSVISQPVISMRSFNASN